MESADGSSAPKQEGEQQEKKQPVKQLVVYTEFGYATVDLKEFTTQLESMTAQRNKVLEQIRNDFEARYSSDLSRSQQEE